MSNPYVGEIRMFAGNFPPAGWAFCNGQPMAISENETLFNLIGTTYGGDGEETFNLPDLQSRVPVHMGTGSSGTTFTIGETGGVESVTLTTQQIPAHNHSLMATTNPGTSNNPNPNLTANSPNVQVYIEDTPAAAFQAQAIASAGGSQPHENLQPYLCINFIISLYGIFPSQS